MARLLSCMIIVCTLAIFASVECIATQMFLSQCLVGVTDTNEVGTNQTKSDQIPQGQKNRADLRDVDLKQLVVIDTTSLIDVTGMPQGDAVDAITAAGLRVEEITYDYGDTVPAGSVVRQYPSAGTRVKSQTGVKLVVRGDLKDLAKRVNEIEEKMLTEKDLKNLEKQVENLEKKILAEWDVAKVFGTIIA